ncbi:MAG: hypothetical protein KKE05_05025 [Nanoarchaeota archaeon]|nr:hypothetical protein [Nanoarchaeota archaeon]
MEDKDFRDDLLIADLPKLDKDMLDDIVKNPIVYNFQGMAPKMVFTEAILCYFENVTKAFKKLGISLPPHVLHFILQSERPKTEFKNIEVENRTKYRDEESWRNGTYIFKNGELTYFIGAPDYQKPSPLSISTHYKVKTNVRL